MTSFFLYCIKKMSFSGSPKGTPHDWCRRTMKKIYPEPKKCSICWVSHMFSIWVFLWHLLWHCLCTPKFYPKYFYPKYSKFFFSVHTRRVEIGHILSRRSWLYMHIVMYVLYTRVYILQYIYLIKSSLLFHHFLRKLLITCCWLQLDVYRSCHS